MPGIVQNLCIDYHIQSLQQGWEANVIFLNLQMRILRHRKFSQPVSSWARVQTQWVWARIPMQVCLTPCHLSQKSPRVFYRLWRIEHWYWCSHHHRRIGESCPLTLKVPISRPSDLVRMPVGLWKEVWDSCVDLWHMERWWQWQGRKPPHSQGLQQSGFYGKEMAHSRFKSRALNGWTA